MTTRVNITCALCADDHLIEAASCALTLDPITGGWRVLTRCPVLRTQITNHGDLWPSMVLQLLTEVAGSVEFIDDDRHQPLDPITGDEITATVRAMNVDAAAALRELTGGAA